MSIARLSAVAFSALFAFSGIKVSWLHFHSTLYPYSIAQPSSFRHAVFQDDAGRPVDYFYPSLGSFTTNVNIYADQHPDSDADYLRTTGGKSVHRTGWIVIEGQRLPITSAEYRSINGHWIQERISLADRSRVWHLTMSYDLRYHLMRKLMVHMLRTFQADGSRRA